MGQAPYQNPAKIANQPWPSAPPNPSNVFLGAMDDTAKLEELFRCFLHPLTELDHETAGRISTLGGRLLPHFIATGDRDYTPQDVLDVVHGARAEFYFHTHPFGPTSLRCWPSLDA